MADKKTKYRVTGAGIYGAEGELAIGDTITVTGDLPRGMKGRLTPLDVDTDKQPVADTYALKTGEGKSEGKVFIVNQNGKHLREISEDEAKAIEALGDEERATRLAELAKG